MTSSSSEPTLLSSTFFIILVISINTNGATNQLGFTVEIIHRDSPNSPSYDNSTTPYQKALNAFHRSAKRAAHFFPEIKSFVDDPETEVIPHLGDYLISYSIGTSPSFETVGTLDTGSDLIWLKCVPCNECFDPTVPSYKSNNSITHQTYYCLSPKCYAASLSVRTSCDFTLSCTYDARYGFSSGSAGSNGLIAQDTLILGSTIGKKVAFPRTLIGCAHETFGRFRSPSSGIVGLGRSSISLISQISSSVQGKFSYCLTPFYYPGANRVLHFGNNAVVCGDEVVSTPLVLRQPETYYYISLEAISVEDIRINFSTEEGNTIVDSGTTFSFLPNDFYNKVEAEVDTIIELDRTFPLNLNTSLCYISKNIESLGAPLITLHFKGDKADVELSPTNTFFLVDSYVSCFAFRSIPSASGIPSGRALLGNTQQTNFLVGYDLYNNIISFKSMDCSNQK